jgi:hypothetical protein
MRQKFEVLRGGRDKIKMVVTVGRWSKTKWKSIRISLIIDSKVTFNSSCQWIDTTIPPSNIEIYDESFGRRAQITGFKAAKIQWDKRGEDNRVSSDYNKQTSFSNKL